MSRATRQWSWSQPVPLASIPSMREWETSKPQRLASVERILAEALPAPAAEQHGDFEGY